MRCGFVHLEVQCSLKHGHDGQHCFDWPDIRNKLFENIEMAERDLKTTCPTCEGKGWIKVEEDDDSE